MLTCSEAKAWETSFLNNEAAEWDAMQQAGTAIAQALLNDFKEIGGLPDSARLLVLVGKGHNGGDALLAAKAILEKHPQATAEVVFCFGETALRPLARRSLDALRGTGLPTRVRVIHMGPESHATSYDLCLDGIFGFQFHPPMDAATAELIARVNTHPRIKLRAAVDLPSGLGETNAGTVFRADFTYATGIVKSPVIADSNAVFVGRLRYLDLGFFEVERVDPNALEVGRPDGKVGRVIPNAPSSRDTIEHSPHVSVALGGALPAPRCATSAQPTGGLEEAPDRILLSSILQPLAQLRPAQTDKRTYGHLFVLGGSRNYPGAVLMTVQAALRSGVGLLTAFVPESLVPEYAARFPEAMWVGLPQTASGGISVAGVPLLLEKLPRATALVIGPGLGADPATLAAVQEVVRNTNIPSGATPLNVRNTNISLGTELADVRNTNIPFLLDADALRPEVLAVAQGKPFVCTPHAGEFKRIAGEVSLRDFCRQSGAVVVQKGPHTRVSDGGAVYYSLFGGPVLARGGSGDLLAGLIGGLLAQGPDNLLLAAARGVVWHGLAADLLARDKGQVAVQTTQLLEYLNPALHEAL